MFSNKKIFALSAALLGVAVVVLLAFLIGANVSVEEASRADVAQQDVSGSDKARKSGVRRVHEKHRRNRGGVSAEKKRPDLSAELSSDELSSLSAEFRKILEDLQVALDADDWRKTTKIVQRMQESSEWPDGVPSVLHHAAIEALKWFGSHTAPELVGYLGSSDTEVVESATEAMIDLLGDFSLSDSERSALMLGYMKVIRDSDTIETMLFELNNMRPTVRAETALAIFKSENNVACKVLQEELDFYFGDAEGYEVSGPEGIQRYLDDAERAYTEDPELAASDEEFYGGEKNAE